MNEKVLLALCLAQCQQIPGAPLVVTVEVEGKPVVFAGEGKNIIPITLHLVELARPSCTPQSVGFLEDAGGRFEEAARELVKNGREFATVLRVGWALPAIVWRVVEKKDAP